MKRFAGPLLVLVVGVVLAVVTAAQAPYGLDYAGSSLDVNRSGDAIQALAQGDLDTFFATQPAIGPVSVLVRAPFAALAGYGRDLSELPAHYHGHPPLALPHAVYESQLRLYRFGVFPCLVALIVLAAFAAYALARAGRPAWIQGLVAVLLMGLPLWDSAISRGHPGEFLTTGLAVGAVLAAVCRRPMLAAVLLGLALGTKQWAVIALPVVLIAVPPSQNKKVIAVVAAVYLALVIPMAIGDPNRFVNTLSAPAISADGLVDTHTIWFQAAQRDDFRVFDGVRELTVPHRKLPDAVANMTHPFIVFLAAGLSVLFWRRRPHDRDPAAIFQLLALLFLLRCLFDPVTNDYYHLPFLASLALYEGLSKKRPPVLTLLATAAFLPRFGVDVAAANWANAFYLLWTVPLAVYLGWSLYGLKPALQPLRPKL